MSAFEVTVRDYSSLCDACRKRRLLLGLDLLQTDRRGKLPPGTTEKIESYAETKWGRNLGPVSMALLMGALGVELLVREVPARQTPERPEQ